MPVNANNECSRPVSVSAPSPRNRLVGAILRWLGPAAAEKVNLGESEQLHAVHMMLTEHLGSSQDALHFMRSFAGCVIRIPEIATCERLARELVVLDRLSRPDFTKEDRRRLSVQLRINRKTIQAIARKGVARAAPQSETCVAARQ